MVYGNDAGLVSNVRFVCRAHLPGQRLAAVIRGYYQGEFEVDTVRAWGNYHFVPTGDHQDVYGNLWHNDEGPITTLRYFVSSSDSAVGALELQSIDCTRRIIRSGFFRRQIICGPARRMLEDPSRTSTSGSLGSGCSWNPQLCLHRAGVPGPGRCRDMVQFWIIPATTALEPDWDRHVRPDPAVSPKPCNQDANRGTVPAKHAPQVRL
jgi:hypothetical protein